MAYIIAEPCINVKDKACVEVCPVDCIYEGPEMLYIHPDDRFARSSARSRHTRGELSRRGVGIQAPAHRGDTLPVGRQPHADGARPRPAADVPATATPIRRAGPGLARGGLRRPGGGGWAVESPSR